MPTFNPNNPWRLVSTAIYSKPVDSRIFGSVELDVTELEQWVNRKREEGLKITLMFPIILLAARALRSEVPELNCYVKRGHVVHRETVDILISVLMDRGRQMTSLRLPEADRMSISQMADWMTEHLHLHRTADQGAVARQKNWLARLGWPFRKILVSIWRKVIVEWGLRIPFTEIQPDAFGSMIFSNIGSIGLDVGYPALFPISNVPMVLVMGSVQTRPAVIDGQIVPRRLLNLSATLDHRVVDAQHGGTLFRYLKRAIRHPEQLES
ncbi:MAG: 2-oxo acid dehydrogenase subunit E2 [Saprospiraceae bacterium]|nr:2-oxo acid dehydrogenase subunit E2 [Saprospiraceae bacterium]